MSEKVQIKYEISARVPKGTRIPDRIKKEAFRAWVKTGQVPRGFRLRVGFRNPDRRKPGPWKWSDQDGQELEEIRKTLNLPGWAAFGSGDYDDEPDEEEDD